MAELTAQLHNWIAAVGDPLMPAAILSLKGMAAAFSMMTQFTHDHPAEGLGISAGALVGGGWLLKRALPYILRSPLARFGLGAAAGGMFGGGMEGLLFGFLLGGTGGEAAGEAAGAGLVGGRSIGLFARATAWVKNIAGVLRSTVGLAVALEALREVINGKGPMLDISKAVWGDLTGSKDRKRNWKNLDNQFRAWVDSLGLKGNPVWEAIKHRAYSDQKQDDASGLVAKYDDRFPALAAYEKHLGYLSPNGRPWRWSGVVPEASAGPQAHGRGVFTGPKTYPLPDSPWWRQPPPSFIGSRPAGRGAFGCSGSARSGPVPVVVTNNKSKEQPTVVNITNNVSVNDRSSLEIARAVGSVTRSSIDTALHDIHR